MKLVKRVAAAGILAAAVAGCTTVGNQQLAQATHASVAAQIVRGKTTMGQVRQMFGDPLTTSFTDSGKAIWKYNLTSAHATAADFIPFVNAFKSEVKGKEKTLVVLFDKNNVVQNYTFSNSNFDQKTGLIQ
ncbi:MAG: outer membrane protein assembly factor BamE [Betaproteobacteria bacterium]|nr:outer membrane protein assembly factor BamE [Betaproteobacteria bacterium]